MDTEPASNKGTSTTGIRGPALTLARDLFEKGLDETMARESDVAKIEAFVVEALAYQHVWTISDGAADDAVLPPDGDAVAFWSLEARVRRAIDRNRHCVALRPIRISTASFARTYLPCLSNGRRMLALNWSGAGTPECVMTPEELMRRLIQAEG